MQTFPVLTPHRRGHHLGALALLGLAVPLCTVMLLSFAVSRPASPTTLLWVSPAGLLRVRRPQLSEAPLVSLSDVPVRLSRAPPMSSAVARQAAAAKHRLYSYPEPWRQRLPPLVRYLLLVAGAVLAWLAYRLAQLRRYLGLRRSARAAAKSAERSPRPKMIVLPVAPPRVSAVQAKEWVLSDNAAMLHMEQQQWLQSLQSLQVFKRETENALMRPTKHIKKSLRKARKTVLQLQAEKEIITQTMDAMKEELEREKELGQREQSVLLGHVEVLKADRERMQSALVVAQREAAEREAAITALQGAEVEVMRLQNALHTSQKVAAAWMGLLLMVGAFGGFLLGTSLGVIAVVITLVGAAAIVYMQRGQGVAAEALLARVEAPEVEV
eukprot:EG_transcript_13879